MVTLKMEIPGALPPLIQEMLEDLDNLEKSEAEGKRAEQNGGPHTVTMLCDISAHYIDSGLFA